MALPTINLTTNKREYLFVQPIVLRAGETGETLTVNLTDGNGLNYDLTDKIIYFEEQKDAKYISDGNNEGFTINGSSFTYTLPDAAYLKSGQAWFRIQDKDGKVVDTTQTFDVQVLDGLNIYNDISYVGALDTAITKANGLLTQIQTVSTDASNKANAILADEQAKIEAWKTETVNGITDNINKDLDKFTADQKAKFDTMSSDWDNLKKQVTDLLTSIPNDPKYKGEKGDPGTGLQLKGTVESSDKLPTDATPGDTYLVAGHLWIFDNGKWTDGGQLQGPKGDPGKDGTDGQNGASAYQVWLDAGNTGTEAEFLESLKGKDGSDGADGADGAEGDSAYQVWLDNGHEGTVDDFIASLKVDLGKVAHLSGANNFDTVPTVNNIPLLLAKAPGIPKLAVTYNATSKVFEYTLTAPDKDGLSDIIQYNLLWKDHSVDGWTTAIVKPDALTGQLTGVEITKTYDFKATAQNAVGSSDSTDVITVPAVDGNIYGVSWDGSSSGVLQRTDAAVGLKDGINGAQNDFDTRGPWGLMDKTVTDSYGNAFVRVPKFYIRKTQNKPLSTWQVSLVKQGDDWYLPNCFYDFDNKKELDYVDVSRYEGSIISGKLQSKTGVTPTSNVDINDFRTAATALNAGGKKGYHLWDVHTLDALQVLFTIEFATLDSQSIMKGNKHGSSAIITGTTDSVKGSSGFVTSGPASMTYRGIENLYGNLAMLTDGLNISNLSLYSYDDATKYVSDTFMYPYYKVSYPLISSKDRNITSLGFDKEHPAVTAPTSFNSDEFNTYYHDKSYADSSGIHVVYTGGSWGWDDGSSGLWFWNGGSSSIDVYSDMGSRLLKKAL